MKKYTLFLYICILTFPTTVQAVCTNSTCITTDMIKMANHDQVEYSPIITHYDYLLADRGYNEPTNTGVTVYRQEAPDKIGVTIKYADGFCTREGAAFVDPACQ